MPEIDRRTSTVEIRAIWEGAAYGLLAGALFLSILVIAAMREGGTPLLTMRWAASVLLGRNAFLAPASTALVIGMAVHLALSAGWGVVFGAIAVQEPAAMRESWLTQLVLGAAFGAVLWLVDIVVLGRLLFAGAVGLSLGLELAIHVVFYGAPLGLLYGLSEQALGASAPES